MTFTLNDVASLVAPQDNVAIATQLLPAETEIDYGNRIFRLSHAVLPGHRFAVQAINRGEALYSWGQTFGIATRSMAVGDYVVNDAVLKELSQRSLEIELPTASNFEDDLEVYQFDEANFVPAVALPRYDDQKTFMGYQRDGDRGVGTRNTIVLLGTTSMVAAFVRTLAAKLQELVSEYPNIDGIVGVAHTEGGHGKSNNQELLLRTLAGFIVHPNVGAVLIIDNDSETINNVSLKNYMSRYPLDSVLHRFMSVSVSFEDDLERGREIVQGWLEIINDMRRSAQPLSELKLALQCGGSDAFSGVSGNPLAAWVAKQVIQYGGAANLAETDELIGAEAYILDKVRDAATAKKFLSFIARFKERVAWHGYSAEANPSGGNKLRGLYNIYLKSLGAASKRHPDVRLDYVIDYSERMQSSGYYFMDSPGNDLESIAGQVAAGCNMIFFVTGNGSITNFPFVPTIKIVTTTERYQLLETDMDINAGAYLAGVPLDDLGAKALQYTIEIASGQLSAGEKAAHSQVQIWRDWQQTQAVDLDALKNKKYSGYPIPIQAEIDLPEVSIELFQNGEHLTSQQIGLILPTSLCSGQIAKLCVSALNQHPMLADSSITRFVTLTHTEGCGGAIIDEFRDTLFGYLGHPFVRHALLLEHGCEVTHNDYFRHAMQARGYDPDNYGWASIQQDGGIQSVIQKMIAYFAEQIARDVPIPTTHEGLSAVRVAIVTHGDVSSEIAIALARVTQMIVRSGGLLVMSDGDKLLNSKFSSELRLEEKLSPTIGYAKEIENAGMHLMEMPTRDWNEILTGLGSSVDLILALVNKPVPGHPMIPVLQISDTPSDAVDVVIGDDTVASVIDGIVDTLSRHYIPKATQFGNVNFQVTRGLLGVSL